jgi:proline dehydrogenase
MPELQWLDGYSGQTVDELIALEGKYRIDSLVLAFEQAIDQKAARDGGEQLSDEELIILAIEAMEREVNNGGWGQFFVNTGQFAPVIVDALQRIRCPKTAKIAQKALKIVEKAPITEDEIENGTWEDNEKRQDALNACDELYFERPENIEESLFAFIKANRAKIEP